MSESMEKLAALVRWQVRGPCEQYAYAECRYCHATWWDDREQHNGDCIVPDARQELRRVGNLLPGSETRASQRPVSA